MHENIKTPENKTRWWKKKHKDKIRIQVLQNTIKFPFFEGLIYRAYVQREICISKSIGLAFLEGNLTFFFVLLCIWDQFPSTSPWGLIFEGAIYQMIFCAMSLGGL